MENVISRTKLASLPDVVKGIQDFRAQETERLTSLCLGVFDYEKEQIHLGNPTADEEQKFIEVLKDLQATVKRTQKALATDDLEWLVNRIQMSLDSLENPMSEEEANEFLDKHFPG